jgi:hypothetical protein
MYHNICAPKAINNEDIFVEIWHFHCQLQEATGSETGSNAAKTCRNIHQPIAFLERKYFFLICKTHSAAAL